MVKFIMKLATLLSLIALLGSIGIVSAQQSCVTDQFGNTLFCTNPTTISNAANLLQNNVIQGIGIGSNLTNTGLLLVYFIFGIIIFGAIALLAIKLYQGLQIR